VNQTGTPARDGAWKKPRLTVRRLFGLDRSGPPPPQTLKGAPLNPWTIPNAIGFLRLALIPVFLIVALSSSDGTGAWPAILFGVIAWTDYADGIAARLTGQYSRLGVLIDPIADRALILSGVIVCWNFELLPRWALAVLAVREVAILMLVRWGLRHDVDVRVNWPGRLAVWPIMTAIFAALVDLQRFAEIMLYVGLALALISFAMYFQIGLAYKRGQVSS
jgi:CDP-diacylglycerol--glycerol-3-phosphate 3-phosphatidyltransferase